jgi:protein arginine kinase
MKSVRELLERPSVWLRGSGPESEVVLSTRVRFARNLAGRPFPQHAPPAARAELLREILELTQGLPEVADELRTPLERLEALERRILGERQLVSAELVEAPRGGGVVIAADESVSFMINEEDHLRIQALASGLDLEGAYGAGEALERALGERLDFAFDPTLGFLTACPTNLGTGMRASVLVHLPALVLSNRMEVELQALQRREVTVRGVHGEGSTAMGNFFQISNAVTLGPQETALLARLREVTHDLIVKERQARTELLGRARTLLEDRIWRSFGILCHARVLTAQETLHHASMLRFGQVLGILELPTRILHDILALGQEAHTEALAGADGGEAERSAWRAETVRAKLHAAET